MEPILEISALVTWGAHGRNATGVRTRRGVQTNNNLEAPRIVEQTQSSRTPVINYGLASPTSQNAPHAPAPVNAQDDVHGVLNAIRGYFERQEERDEIPRGRNNTLDHFKRLGPPIF